MATFVYNIVNAEQASKALKRTINFKCKYKQRRLQLSKQISNKSIVKNYGEATFVYIYSKFINNIILNDLNLHFYSFKKLLYNNLKFYFIKLTEIFPKFDLWLKT
jgi:hypothetical protein